MSGIIIKGDNFVHAERPLGADDLPKKAPMDQHIEDLFKVSINPATGKPIVQNNPMITFGDISQERWDSIFGKK